MQWSCWRLVVVGFLAAVHAETSAGDPAGGIFRDGFELPNRYVDVSAGIDRLCVVDVVGNLFCAEPPGSDDYPDFLGGRFVDLAGTESGICVRDAADSIRCFGPDPLVPGAGFEQLIAGTAGFLPDLRNSICAPDAGSTTIHCVGDAPPAALPVNDFTTSSPTDLESRACWAPQSGGIECELNGSPGPVLGTAVFEEVALGGAGDEAVVCGLTNGLPVCYALLTGLETAVRAGISLPITQLSGDRFGSFCGLRVEGELVCWMTEQSSEPGNTIVQNRGNDSLLARVETHSVLYGATCGIDLVQRIDCWGENFAGAGIAPAGAGWARVHSAGGTMAWAHPQRSPGLRGGFSDQLRSADGFAPPVEPSLREALAACGLRDGEFRCINGTDRWGVPEGPWQDLSVSRNDPVSWCGVDADGLLACASRLAGSQLSNVPAGVFSEVVLFLDTAGPAPEETAYALGADGSLECWGTGGPCAAAAFTDFVRIGKGSVLEVGLRANGDVVSLSSGSFVAASESFDRFRGGFGFRADGSFAWWAFPDRAVPSGAYLDVTGASIGFGGIQLNPGPGPAPTSVDGCAVGADGGLDCWRDDAGSAVIEFQVDGNYRQVHRSIGIMLTDAAGTSDTFAGVDLGSPLTPAAEYLTSFGLSCMTDLSGRLGCKGGSIDELSPVNQTSDSYRGLALDGQRLCALNSNDRVECWSLFGASPLAFPDQAFDSVAVGRDHACGATQSNTLIHCVGNNPLNPLPANPFPALAQPGYRDLASSAFATCVILPDGSMDCASAGFLTTALPDPSARYVQVEIEAFSRRFCLLSESGTIECFVQGDPGQPLVPVFSASGNFVDFAFTERELCAIDDDGRGRCWSIETRLAEWNVELPQG